MLCELYKLVFTFKMNQYLMEAYLSSSDFGEDAYLYNSSSSSDSDEDDCTCQYEEALPAKKIKAEGFIELEVPRLNEYDFKNSFRVTRATYDKVLEMLYDSFNSDHKGGRERISPEKATYMLLWYLGNQETFKQMADRFKNTMSSIHCILRTATRTLSVKMHEQILWPSDVEYPNISQIFQEISNLNGCIGVLGVSYMKIPKPKDNVESYMCIRNYPCLALQGVVTVNGKFLDIFISEGSNDAEQLLQKSNLLTEANSGLLGDDYFLVGYPEIYSTDDVGLGNNDDDIKIFVNHKSVRYVGFNNYLCRKWLVQRFKDQRSSSSKQTYFNECHEAAAKIFPESLGFLKGRFQRLQNFENRDIVIVTQCIESACMIHNLAIDCDDNSDDLLSDSGIFDNDSADLSDTEFTDSGTRDRVLRDLWKSTENIELNEEEFI